jgi:hypothetical protein
MRSKKLIVPKAYGKSSMYSGINESDDEEDSSTGTVSDDLEDSPLPPPTILIPIATRRRKVSPTAVVLQEETDFIFPHPIKNSNPRVSTINTAMIQKR